MIPPIVYQLSAGAIFGTWVWARRGGFDPYWRIVSHVLSIVTYLVLWIVDIIMQLQ